MSKDINVHITTETDKQKVDAYGNSFDNAGKKVNSAGGHAEGATRKMTALGSAVNSVTGFLTGLISIRGLWEFFQKWLDYIKEISEAQKGLVESTKSLNQAAKSLAGQANIMGVPGGFEAAREQILTIFKAGRLSSFETAEGVAVSAHSAFGTSGQLLTPGQLGIAGAAANFARLKNISPGAIDDLFKVLAAEGVSNEDEAKLRIQQLSTVQQASKIKSFEQFMPGAIKSMIPAMAKGASPEMALSQYAAALDTSASAEIAAESTKQAADIMLRPDVAAAIGGGFADLPYDQQIAAFSQWVTRSTNEQLMAAKLEPTQVGRMKTLYKPGQLGRVVMFRGLSASSTAEKLNADLAVWDASDQGKIEALETEAAIIRASGTQEEQRGQALIDAGEAMWERMKANKQNRFFVPDAYEKPGRTVWWPLKQRAEALRRARRQKAFLFDKKDEELSNVDSYLAHITPGPVHDLTPAEVGRANTMLEPLERQAGITVYDYSTNTVFARPGIDPSPRVKPSNIEN